MKSTQLLIQEHKLILRALDVLDAISFSMEKTGSVPDSDVEAILDFLRWFGDGHHQAKEEAILFPALKKASASQDRPVDHLALEHNQERSMVEDIETGLRLAKLPEFIAAASRLSSVLRNHIYKEDRLLFETADALLTPEEDQAVFEHLSQFDTELDRQILSEKLKTVRLLEWKYLRKQ